MLIVISSLAGLVGVTLLRWAWDAREPARVRLTLFGWALILMVVVALGWRYGAWGLAVASMPVMLGAFLFLTRAAIESRPPARAARATVPDPTVRLHVANWSDVARRVGVFVLSVPVAGIVSVLVGLAVATVARAAGAVESNMLVTMLVVTPVVWSVLGVVLLLSTRLLVMARPLAALGIVSGAVVWALG